MRFLVAPLLLSFAFLMTGCGPAETTPAPPAAAPTNAPKSTMQTAIDGFTGKTAVEAGQRAKQRIQDVHRKEQGALDEVMGP